MNENTKIVLKFIKNNFIINDITTYDYYGKIVGAPPLIYNNKILYLANLIEFISRYGSNPNKGIVMFYDYSNNIINQITENELLFNALTGVANFKTSDFSLKNVLFSRFSVNEYLYVNLVGYRITLQ